MLHSSIYLIAIMSQIQIKILSLIFFLHISPFLYSSPIILLNSDIPHRVRHAILHPPLGLLTRLHPHLTLLALLFLLFRLLNKRLEVTQVRHHVSRQAVLDYSEVGNRGVYLLRRALFSHHPEHVLLLVRFLTELLQRVCLCCNVQFWCFALACEVREHLSTLEFLL
jgi:hypothetical protein